MDADRQIRRDGLLIKAPPALPLDTRLALPAKISADGSPNKFNQRRGTESVYETIVDVPYSLETENVSEKVDVTCLRSLPRHRPVLPFPANAPQPIRWRSPWSQERRRGCPSEEHAPPPKASFLGPSPPGARWAVVARRPLPPHPPGQAEPWTVSAAQFRALAAAVQAQAGGHAPALPPNSTGLFP